MKWLFAVLVALNIIVFGGMVASRVAEKQKNARAPAADTVGVSQQQPAPPVETLRPSENSAPVWTAETASAPAPEQASAPETDEAAAAEKARKEQEQQEAKEQEAKEREAKEKKEREEKAKREQQEKAKREQESRERAADKKEAAQCTAAATLTLNEDDYHRIKGLLRPWAHAASRTVEKRSGQDKAAQPQKTYRVLVSADGDAAALLESLSDKGFSGSVYEDGVSVGVTRSRSAAQVLISRLATAGFGGTRIQEQEDRAAPADNSLSVARMQVTFMDVDDKSAQEIQKIVERYGKLNRRACR